MPVCINHVPMRKRCGVKLCRYCRRGACRGVCNSRFKIAAALAALPRRARGPDARFIGELLTFAIICAAGFRGGFATPQVTFRFKRNHPMRLSVFVKDSAIDIRVSPPAPPRVKNGKAAVYSAVLRSSAVKARGENMYRLSSTLAVKKRNEQYVMTID